MFPRLKRLLLGSPIHTAELHEQRLTKKGALGVFAADPLSSSAYATEEILLALVAGGTAALSLSLPAAVGIITLMGIVAISYSQTIHAYPSGGGAYIVAKENLGVTPALVAAAALLIDYVLTVAVSIAAGVAAITSALPELHSYTVPMCLGAVAILLLGNLRGVRESALLFGIPVYGFVFCGLLLLGGGAYRIFMGGQSTVAPPELPMTEQLPIIWLYLRAFASGCAALTGIEAVSNGVQAFRQPVSRNASITLFWMVGLLGTLFIGITLLAVHYGIVPRPGETVISQINRTIFSGGPIYYLIQGATFLILFLAANTAFADFPRLASILAKDRFAPRQLANLGDRLIFSNGAIVLATTASLLMIVFRGQVHALIPLYMVGVFLSFTLSQSGMVVHWRAAREPGTWWRLSLNAFGACLTAIVLVVVAIVKFTSGAWIVLVAIPMLASMFRRVRDHYAQAARELSLSSGEHPRVSRHTVIIPVPPTPNRVVLTAVEYAKSISQDVIAVTVNTDGREHQAIIDNWKRFVADVPLVVLDSPYRSVLQPLLRFIDEIEDLRDDDKLTVLLPEFVPDRWWHNLLHNQTSLLLKGALLFREGIIVTSVPFHLRGEAERKKARATA